MRILSWILSLFLHVGVAYAGAYLATPKAVRVSLDTPVYQVDLVRLAPARKAKPKPRPVVLNKPAPAPEPAPLPKAEEISPAEKKVPEKKPVPEKPAKPKPDPKRVLAEALTHAKKDVAWLERMDRKALEKELSGLRESVAEEDSALRLPGAETGNATGDASSEDGLIAIYAKLVEMAVKENWRFPRIHSEKVLVAKVEIHVNPDGGILDYKLLVSSGRPDFDASALKAVDETKQLPIPPRPDLNVLRINFNLQELEVK
ncbi:MAG: TonB family protein [Thermodesulfobacteriota bacterium]|nr:TonB family protein [Thermodesulfobacteriota bacterium]